MKNQNHPKIVYSLLLFIIVFTFCNDEYEISNFNDDQKIKTASKKEILEFLNTPNFKNKNN